MSAAEDRAMRRNLGTSAAHYARMGWPILPIFNPVFGADGSVSCACGVKTCDNVGKHPHYLAVKHGLNGASSDLEQVKAWWTKFPDASIGIRTGRKAPEGEKEEGCGYVLVDVDEGWKDGRLMTGEDQLEILDKVVGGLPETWETTTGRGRHLWYKHPGGDFWIPNRGHITLQVPEWYQDVAYVVDVKGRPLLELGNIQVRGESGYVVAAPSSHRTGGNYRWHPERNPRLMPDAAPMPEALVHLLMRTRNASPDGKAGGPSGAAPSGDWPDMEKRLLRAKRYMETVPGAVSGQGGDNATFSMAADLVRGFVLPLETAYELMCDFNLKCVPPWDIEDISRKIEQAAYNSVREYGYKYKNDGLFDLELEAKRAAREEEDIMSQQARMSAQASAARVLDTEEAPGGPNPPGPPTPTDRGGGHGDDGGRGLHHVFVTGSEVEIAEAYRAHLEQDGRLLTYSESYFWLYDPRRGVWVKQDDALMEGDISTYDGSPTGENGKPLKMSASMCSGAMKILTKRFGSSPEAAIGRNIYRFNRSVRGIAFRNGFLRIDVSNDTKEVSIKLVPHSPANLSRFHIDMDWRDEAYPSPIFDKFMDNLFHDVEEARERGLLKNLIQEFVGTALAGVTTSFQCYMLLLGNGNNGKSELLSLVKGLFNKDHTSFVPPDQFDKNFQLRPLAGATINIVDDMPATPLSSGASSKLRSISSGHNVHLDVKYREPTTFDPIAAHLFAANELFDFPENTDGSWRRVLVVPMNADFSIRPDLRVPNISKIIMENEMLQVVQWAIRGLVRLIRDQGGKFSTPATSRDAKEEWKEEGDNMYRFLLNASKDIKDQLKTRGGVQSIKLMEAYHDWIRAESPSAFSRNEMTMTMFGRKAKSSGLLQNKRTGKGVTYFAEQKLVNIWAERDQRLSMLDESNMTPEQEKEVIVFPTVPPHKEAKP
jgi:putative DNA primase/helicase